MLIVGFEVPVDVMLQLCFTFKSNNTILLVLNRLAMVGYKACSNITCSLIQGRRSIVNRGWDTNVVELKC